MLTVKHLRESVFKRSESWAETLPHSQLTLNATFSALQTIDLQQILVEKTNEQLTNIKCIIVNWPINMKMFTANWPINMKLFKYTIGLIKVELLLLSFKIFYV